MSKHHNDTCLKEIRLCLQILITSLHSILHAMVRTYVLSSLEINKYAILMVKIKAREVQLLHMPHCRFANATRVSLCKSNR